MSNKFDGCITAISKTSTGTFKYLLDTHVLLILHNGFQLPNLKIL